MDAQAGLEYFAIPLCLENSCTLGTVRLKTYRMQPVCVLESSEFLISKQISAICAVIWWVINHCLEVCCKVDQVTSAEHEWCISLRLAKKVWFIIQQIKHKSWLFRFKHIENDGKVIVPFRFYHLSTIAQKNHSNSFDCNADVHMQFLRCWLEKNDVRPSYVVATKTDVSKVSIWRQNGTMQIASESRFRPVICWRINHWFSPLPI